MARFGYLQLIRCCNQRCRFCSNPDTMAVLPTAEALAAIDDFAARGFGGVLLTGGEPTLYADLAAVLAHARTRGVAARLITNGQRTADRGYLETLVAAGLGHVHLSLQSHRPEVQAALTENPASLPNLVATLEHLGALGVTTDINTTLNAANADHLDQTVEWLCGRFPWLRHWVFNNLDPTSERALAHREVLTTPRQLELSLHRALRFLDRTGRTFRVERVPLCYMTEYAWASTETRKLVKGESREVAFLDERGRKDDAELWGRYTKAPGCAVCTLQPICAGVFAADVHDVTDELYPVFVSRERIVERVRGG